MSLNRISVLIRGRLETSLKRGIERATQRVELNVEGKTIAVEFD
ncbi:hypothetical protein P0D71_19340 [Paraburkholderia sp. RL17-383-BIF-A]